MVDRFFNGDSSNDGTVDRADPHAFHGGDLAGIRQKIDYLAELGVTTVWLSPVFEMRTEKVGEWGAFHGYWVKDLSRVEPRFGTAEDLRDLSRELHRNDMKLVLDMVWNHTDYEAPLRTAHPDWYHQRGDITDWDDPVDVVQGDVHGLPDLAQEKPEVAAFLKRESLAWVDKADADGFRVDAVRHMPLDFLAEMNAALDAKRPDFWTVGEDFNGDATALARTLNAGGFDAVFDFPLRYAMVDVFCKDAAMGRLAGVLSADRLVGAPERLVTFLDNHDVPRILHECGGEGWRVDAAFTFLMNIRGTPALTWGTELGLEGGEEPDNRRDMPWGRLNALHGDRRVGVRRAMAARRDNPAARIGASRILSVGSDRMVLAQVLADSAVVLRVWRGMPTAAPSLPAWATVQGVERGATTRQSGGPESSEDGAGLHIHVERLRWTGSGPAPWQPLVETPAPRTVRVSVSDAPPGDIRVAGAPPELGGWDPRTAPPLTRTGDGAAEAELTLPAGEVASLKLVVVDASGQTTWEPRSNRTLHVDRGEHLTTVEYAWGR
ncbi:MAG: alpha-amylase family glycosyl hydrolase [Myxococcota bacterium]|nr:alpha-amylase family glycosyl hydrolase [Myxococcota bacterium]